VRKKSKDKVGKKRKRKKGVKITLSLTKETIKSVGYIFTHRSDCRTWSEAVDLAVNDYKRRLKGRIEKNERS
jgi:hypothetical protein